MKHLYETKISDARWYAYDLPGNIGWIAYIVALILCFTKRPDFMQNAVMRGIVSAAVLPALLMLTGITELIHERIKKQDRILPRWQLLLGFGALTLGGVLGAVVAFAGMIYGAAFFNNINPTIIIVMFAGGVLCFIFAGLLYKGYKRR